MRSPQSYKLHWPSTLFASSIRHFDSRLKIQSGHMILKGRDSPTPIFLTKAGRKVDKTLGFLTPAVDNTRNLSAPIISHPSTCFHSLKASRTKEVEISRIVFAVSFSTTRMRARFPTMASSRRSRLSCLHICSGRLPPRRRST
jgi:hypothetical protein